MKMRSVLALAFLILASTGYSQVKYSKADLAEIRKKRVQERLAYKKWDRQLHYEVGAFFDKIYHKYRDTSMSAAIRNYTKSTESEGDLMDPGSLLSAFRLGEIYQSGIGSDTNYAKAMFYFLLSGEKGSASLSKLQDQACNEPRVLFASPDSIVIAFSPFCIRNPKSFAFLQPMVDKIREDHGNHISLSIRYPLIGIENSYYSYYNRQLVPQKAAGVIGEYLQPLISPDRLSYIIQSEPYEGEEHLMTFVITEHDR